ncbi:MAG: hypothetical protein JNL83_09190 [Myxococcales bacterium]|nr:hypothetical protein [Myxococcales bacterium]
MLLVPLIFIIGLLTLVWVAGLPAFGLGATLAGTVLLVGVAVGLLRSSRPGGSLASLRS